MRSAPVLSRESYVCGYIVSGTRTCSLLDSNSPRLSCLAIPGISLNAEGERRGDKDAVFHPRSRVAIPVRNRPRQKVGCPTLRVFSKGWDRTSCSRNEPARGAYYRVGTTKS